MRALLLFLPGCFGAIPTINEPPRLVSFNGIPYGDRHVEYNSTLAGFEQGEPFELTLEVEDPENDHVRIWFPQLQGEMDFDPDETSGVWYPPDWDVYALELALEDDRDPPARSSYYLSTGGYTYGYGYTYDSGGSGGR